MNHTTLAELDLDGFTTDRCDDRDYDDDHDDDRRSRGHDVRRRMWGSFDRSPPGSTSRAGRRTLDGMELLARDLMERNVLTVPAAMPFAEIQHLFVVAGCHGAPVVDEAGDVVGIISVMDLLRAADQAYDEDRDPGEGEDFDFSQMQAIELAAPEPVWIEAAAPVLELAQLMRREGVHHVLVREEGKLVGIVSAFDLCRAIGA